MDHKDKLAAWQYILLWHLLTNKEVYLVCPRQHGRIKPERND